MRSFLPAPLRTPASCRTGTPLGCNIINHGIILSLPLGMQFHMLFSPTNNLRIIKSKHLSQLFLAPILPRLDHKLCQRLEIIIPVPTLILFHPENRELFTEFLLEALTERLKGWRVICSDVSFEVLAESAVDDVPHR